LRHRSSFVRLDEEDSGAPLWVLGAIPSREEQMLELLRETVGADALGDLDDAPLPDEPLELSGVAEDVHGRVAEVAGLLDAFCEELLDVEHRTACRRFLRDVAAAEPDVFRRGGRTETAAAAIVWIVVKANRGFSQREGGLTAKALGEWFGVGNNPGQRAPTLLQAIGVPAQRSSDPRRAHRTISSPTSAAGSSRHETATSIRTELGLREACLRRLPLVPSGSAATGFGEG